MRLLTVAALVVLLVQLQPVASAAQTDASSKNCTVHLGDPTNPRVYGDCLGPYSRVIIDGRGIDGTGSTGLATDRTQASACTALCDAGETQGAYVAVQLHGTQAPPDVSFSLVIADVSAWADVDAKGCDAGVTLAAALAPSLACTDV